MAPILCMKPRFLMDLPQHRKQKHKAPIFISFPGIQNEGALLRFPNPVFTTSSRAISKEQSHAVSKLRATTVLGECRDRPVRLLPRYKMHAKLGKIFNVPNHHILRRIRNCS